MPDTFARFTDQARRALRLAADEASHHRHGYIGTEHLLLGLMAEQEGAAADVFAEFGLGLEDARQQLQTMMAAGEQDSSGEIGLTPRAKEALGAAVDEADRLAHDHVGTEHLLLGLLADEHALAGQMFGGLGVSPRDIKHAVEHRL
jgi:ATP-dependent Clp protease ATP-binding subunit ClpC